MTRLPTGFAVPDRPAKWTRPRASCRPEALERPLGTLRGVGPTAARRLVKLGLQTIDDLLCHAPRNYEREVGESRIVELFGEQEAVITGEVLSVTKRRTRRRLAIVTAVVEDETGRIPAVWFGREWVADKLQPGTFVRLRGQQKDGQFRVKSQDFGDAAATADLAPIYPASEEVPSPRLRALVDQILPLAATVPDLLPAELGPRLELPIKGDALHALHRPRSREEADTARRRLALEELLVLQVGLARRRREREDDVARALPPPGELVQALRAALPFRLTAGQEQAITELDADLARAVPMERLLQGDVGSGKTVVALYALLRAVEAGFRGALMAPTETLAEQHFLTVESYLHAARSHLRPADELGRQARSRACRRRGRRRRHARPHPGGRRSRPAGSGRRRRAASLRRRAAQGALRRERGRTRST